MFHDIALSYLVGPGLLQYIMGFHNIRWYESIQDKRSAYYLLNVSSLSVVYQPTLFITVYHGIYKVYCSI